MLVDYEYFITFEGADISMLAATVVDTANFEHLSFERADKTLTLTK